MKNKIIVSLLLIFLLAISLSTVSANEDLSDAIAETSDADLEIGSVDDGGYGDAIITETISDESTENFNEEDIEEIDSNNKDKLGDNGVTISNSVTINDLGKFEKYVGTGETYSEGTIFILNDSVMFNLTHAQNLKKSCTIEGGTIRGENLDCLFNIESPANGGASSVTIRNTKFFAYPNQNIINAKGVTQGINHILNVAGITLENITIIDLGETITSTVTLLNIESEDLKTELSGTINITGNALNGAKALKFNEIQMSHDGLDESEIYLAGNEIIFPKNTRIVLNSNVIQYAVDKSMGDSPFNFQLKLVDEDGNALANKTIHFALDTIDYTAVTNSDGIATLKVSLSKAKTYDIFSIFNGDERYYGSQMVANTITIKKKAVTLTAKNISYKSTATKKLSVTVKTAVYDIYTLSVKSYKVMKNKKVTFTVNGKTYTATTNSKGVATVKINLNKKGTYTYKVKFAGNSTYAAVTKSAKLTIKPVATSLTTKKYTYKKKTKTKKLKATLKDSSGKILKSKKVTFKVNGKTYSAKTNSKGIVTVKIKLTKKGTFKYTVKFAGDNMYKATSKTNKVVIK